MAGVLAARPRSIADAGRPAAAAPRASVHGALACAAAVLATVALLVVPGAAQTAAPGGYDPGVAHLLLAVLALLCATAAFALPAGAYEPPPAGAPAAPGPRRAAVLAASVVFALVVLAYFPPFLARYGPYGEDKYFLSVLLRVLDGQLPYAGFEFLYGPLLLYPAAAWIRGFGYSLHSYYALLALVEAATFAALAYVLVRRLHHRRTWLAALVVAGVLLVNDNLGLSWIALRRLLPVLVLLAWAAGRSRRTAWLLAGALLGVQIVLSLEYAIACGVALAAAGLVEAAAARTVRPVAHAAAAGVCALATASALALLMTGPAALDWLLATWRIIVLRGGGEAGFPFQVSVNALAVLALFFLACARIGAGARDTLRGAMLQAGDRLLIAGAAYALIAFRSGLARSDMYHLVPPVLVLVAAALLPLRTAVLHRTPAWRRVELALLALLCLTYAPGLAGAGRLWAQGWVLGARDVITGRPAVGAEHTVARGPWIGAERSAVRPEWASLAAFLAAGEHAATPVIYYGGAWGLDRFIGVPKPRGIHATDDYLVSEAEGLALRDYLMDNPAALVVIDRTEWEGLPGVTTPPAAASMFWPGGTRSSGVRLLEYWSSSHFGTAVADEVVRKQERWARTVGAYLVERYEPAFSAGPWLVLSRRS